MSFREEKFLSYPTLGATAQEAFLEGLKPEEVHSLFLEILNNGMHGICFSLYEDGQKPGDIIGTGQIERRIKILKPYTSWVRSFSCTEGNERIPEIARKHGLKTLVGAWLGSDAEKNEAEIEGLIQLAQAGMVDIAAVGNEVLYRKDLDTETLLAYIARVKKALPGIPVGYVDAYYEFVKRPEIAEACDVLLCNCYPYWEGTGIQDAISHMHHMYHQVVRIANGKKVIITETGWPSQGEGLGSALPSKDAALQYFINTQLWAANHQAEVFYFSSFDESWKVGAEGEVGAYWGIWDKHEKLKY